MAHNWKAGDRARFVYDRVGGRGACKPGDEVVVIAIEDGIGAQGLLFEVFVKNSNGTVVGVLFDQLEPILDLGSWGELQKSIGWNPTKNYEKTLDTVI